MNLLTWIKQLFRKEPERKSEIDRVIFQITIEAQLNTKAENLLKIQHEISEHEFLSRAKVLELLYYLKHSYN